MSSLQNLRFDVLMSTGSLRNQPQHTLKFVSLYHIVGEKNEIIMEYKAWTVV